MANILKVRTPTTGVSGRTPAAQRGSTPCSTPCRLLPKPAHAQQQREHAKPHREFLLRAAEVSTETAAAPSAAQNADAAEAEKRSATSTSGISSGIRLENISMTFKNQQVLKDCSWEVKNGEIVGLVGVNGAGKTTQLQIVMGKLFPDGGQVVKAKKNMKIAYLNQEFSVKPTNTLREEFLSVYNKYLQKQKRQEGISKELEEVGGDMERMQVLLDELDVLNRELEEEPQDVQLLDKSVDKIMSLLGFAPEDSDRLVASFSGGWQMRICLGKALLEEPDLLLLDEPTNHLDLDAIQFLEGYLRQLASTIPMVVCSHDREFLDQLCTKVVETERGVASTYAGNYTQYVASKNEREAVQWAAWEKQQKELSKNEDIIRRLTGGAQSGRAAQAEKAIERIKAEGLIEKPFVPKKRSFTFPPVEKMGQRVLSIEGLKHGYPGRPLFNGVDLEIEKGERIAIIGPNGCGKSTLLRLVMGQEQPNEGRVMMGEHNIVPNYFQQNQAEALDLDQTVLDTLVRTAPDAKLNDLKALLGRMLFSGTSMEKKVRVLSGGEKARLALAKFMCTQGTLLVLDEPTNHLDIPSKEMLEEAIRAFQGSVIAVSHDRYFLRQIATRILLVQDGQLVDFKGDYEYFLEKNEGERAKMEVKQEKAETIAKDNIKAKSKMTRVEKEKMKKDKARAFNAANQEKKKKK